MMPSEKALPTTCTTVRSYPCIATAVLYSAADTAVQQSVASMRSSLQQLQSTYTWQQLQRLRQRLLGSERRSPVALLQLMEAVLQQLRDGDTATRGGDGTHADKTEVAGADNAHLEAVMEAFWVESR